MFSLVRTAALIRTIMSPWRGARFELTSPASRGSAPTPSVVTFLFTDVEGSTRLLQDVGPDYADYVQSHRRLLRCSFVANGRWTLRATRSSSPHK
jgi:class 3 adenylate cyclase